MSSQANFMRTLKCTLLLGVASALLLVSSGLVEAASKAEKRRAAEELVKEALQREIFGNSSDREQLLSEAAKTAPDYAPAMWHMGYVRHKNKWVKANDLPQLHEEDTRITQYRKIRTKYADTAPQQLELANWCNKRGLNGQERAHLTQVIRLDPDNRDARQRLGFRRVEGIWTQPAELGEAVDQLRHDREALAEWRPKVQDILKSLKHRSELRRDAGRAKLLAIKDPRAALAIEGVLASDSEPLAMLAVEAVGKISQQEASLALARIAVFSPWEQVRQKAAKQLRDRPKDAYVPTMLASMFSPVQTQMQVFRGQGGRIMYRHSFFREGQDENQMLVMETAYRRIAQPEGDADDTTARALSSIRENAINAEQIAADQNRRTEELNSRISWALSSATGRLIPPSPERWWDWWTQYNEVYVEGQKQTRTVQQQREVAIVDRTQGVQNGTVGRTGQGVSGRQTFPMDCLAAGTSVWTSTGPVAVEDLQIGDLVLSQSIETGELAYKPVLRTTIRPKSTLIKITAGKETIEASGGHPLWVSGEGWIKARELEPGMELHRPSGSVRVTAVEASREEQTYNLIVADFNTYFVGENQILSHDNTIRETTDAIVPGLIDQ